MTKGEKIVRAEFNVSEGDTRSMIMKLRIAILINDIDQLGKDPRLTAIAITKFEEAAMFAVKSLTAK